MYYTKYILAAPGKAAGQLMAANELGIGWVSVWVSVLALQIDHSAILVCDNNLDLMCVFMASRGIVCLFPLYRFSMVLAFETS